MCKGDPGTVWKDIFITFIFIYLGYPWRCVWVCVWVWAWVCTSWNVTNVFWYFLVPKYIYQTSRLAYCTCVCCSGTCTRFVIYTLKLICYLTLKVHECFSLSAKFGKMETSLCSLIAPLVVSLLEELRCQWKVLAFGCVMRWYRSLHVQLLTGMSHQSLILKSTWVTSVWHQYFFLNLYLNFVKAEEWQDKGRYSAN